MYKVDSCVLKLKKKKQNEDIFLWRSEFLRGDKKNERYWRRKTGVIPFRPGSNLKFSIDAKTSGK